MISVGISFPKELLEKIDKKGKIFLEVNMSCG
jgi:metal-responsive CopG/Arc/MetJ family transcriptional regulator